MPEVDFAAADAYLRRAREAREAGDESGFIAHRYLVMLALGVSLPPPVNTKGK